jgi:hypothetical protein
MRIATTASPVSGADMRERMEELRLMLKIERSVQLICRTWKKHVRNLFWGNGTENTARRVSSRQLSTEETRLAV